jgi:uncharacterized MnhB-related membrane protein
MSDSVSRPLPPVFQWTAPGRAVVFVLSAASIWCLLAEFYGICSMRTFTLWILIPATVLLVAIAILDLLKGDRRLWRAVVIGAVGGLLAAFAYDIFRIPFVVAAAHQSGPAWMRLPLYQVFPQFGAMILRTHPPYAEPYTLAERILGWVYHFSNGITFGVMYMAIIGDARRRSWIWAIVLAVGLELAMLFTPYTGFFGIGLTLRFVIVTLIAHLIFGVALGWYTKLKSLRWPAPALAT